MLRWVAKLEEIKSYGLNLSEADLKGALKNEQAANDKKKKDSKDDSKKDDKADYQLIRALDLVKALYLYGQNDNANVTSQKDEKKAK